MDRRVASARTLSVVILVLTFTALHIVYDNHVRRRTFNSARLLFAYWLLCDELLADYHAPDPDTEYALPTEWATGKHAGGSRDAALRRQLCRLVRRR